MTRSISATFDDAKQLWIAVVGGRTFEGTTARILRGEVERALGVRPLKVSVRFDERTEEQLSRLAAHAAELAKEQRSLRLARDRLNLKRVALAERMLASRCSVEKVAERLEVHPTQLTQLLDPRHSSGKRIVALRAGTIKPGAAPGRRWESGADAH